MHCTSHSSCQTHKVHSRFYIPTMDPFLPCLFFQRLSKHQRYPATVYVFPDPSVPPPQCTASLCEGTNIQPEILNNCCKHCVFAFLQLTASLVQQKPAQSAETLYTKVVRPWRTNSAKHRGQWHSRGGQASSGQGQHSVLRWSYFVSLLSNSFLSDTSWLAQAQQGEAWGFDFAVFALRRNDWEVQGSPTQNCYGARQSWHPTVRSQ